MAERRVRSLLIAPIAESDLAETWAYIAEDSPKAATSFIEQIEAKFTPLLEFPGMGASRDHLAPGLRLAPFKNYCIYYTYTDTDVTIVRVVHGARDVRSIF